MQRVESVDLMKGIAILLVVLGHAIGAITSSHTIVNIPESFFISYEVIYSFHMPVFFLIAGLFIERWTRKGWREAFKKKIYRLAVPYFAWGFLMAVYKQLGSSYANSQEGIYTFLLSPFVPWNIFWFLYVLLFIQILYYGCIKCLGDYKKGRRIFLLVSAIMFFVSFFLPDVWIVHRLFRFMLFFSIGTFSLDILAKFEQNMNYGRLLIITGIFILVNFIYVGIFDYQEHTAFRSWFFLVTGLAGTFLTAAFSWILMKRHDGMSNFFRACGEKSMEIYVSHAFLIGFFRVIFLKGIKIEALWPRTILIFVLSTIACYLIWSRINTRNRIYKFMFGIRG